MRKVIVNVAMSLDGFMADKKGKTNWVKGVSNEYYSDYGYGALISHVDTILMGRNTFNSIIDTNEEWPYDLFDTYVFTHEELEDSEMIHFIQDDVKTVISELKKEDGEDIWVYGGSELVNQLLEKNLIDELQVSIIPVLLKEGLPLFKGSKKLELDIEDVSEENGIVTISYKRRSKRS